MDVASAIAQKIDNYQRMMADARRVSHFDQAIRAAVRPGDVVADVGCGPGLLALLAWRAGAAKVYAVERDETVALLAQRIVEANGAQDVVQVIKGDARTIDLERPVDLIVSETLGNFGIDEGTCESVSHFAQRNLKPGGRFIPESLDILLVPVQYRNEFRGVWRRRTRGVDFSPAIDLPSLKVANLCTLRRRQKEHCAPVVLRHVSFGAGGADEALDSFRARMEISQSGCLDGFVGFFRAHLIADLELCNYPSYPGCNWMTWNWPVGPPRVLSPGQMLDIELSTNGGGNSINWQLSWRILDS